MEKKFPGKITLHFTFLMATALLLSFFVLCSFKARQLTNDFLKELGLTKPGADEKITNSILGGYVDAYGLKNAKNMALGNRRVVTRDLLGYIKKHVSTPEFIKEYHKIRDSEKPVEQIPETPEQMRNQAIENAKKAVATTEASLRKADLAFKSIFEKSVADAKKNLKDVEDPNNKYQVNYARNYPQLVKSFKDGYNRLVADWNTKYPENQLIYVKKRLVEFMNATANVDFSAQLTEKGGKKIFVQPEYERKDNRWKMAFRAGKEVVETSREFVQKWMGEIQ